MKRIDKYNLIAELKRGQYATVYRAYEAAKQRFVLLKVLHASDAALRERFAQEAQILTRLAHRNIVRIYECGQAPVQPGKTLPFLAMEFVEGGTLADVIAARRLPVELVIYFSREIVAGLEAAHRNHIVHRDLKPQNLLVDAEGCLKVTDFGLAAFMGGENGGAIIGTPQYMSPEQAAGEAATPASDYFSLGVIMYEMLAGNSPFDGETINERLYRVMHENPAPLAAMLPEAALPLARLVQQLLEKKCAKRLSRPEQILSTLDACEHELARRARGLHLRQFLTDPAGYAPEKILPKKAKPARPTARLSAGLMLVLLLALAGGAWQLVKFTSQKPQANLHNGSAKIAAATLPTAAQESDSIALPAVTPDAPETSETAPPQSESSEKLVKQQPEPEMNMPEQQETVAEEARVIPAPPVSGSLRIACLPFAQVILDGDTLGPVDMQPVIFTAPAGEHVLELANPRFPTYQRRFEVAAADTFDVQLSLWETVARLTLYVKPWAEVFIDGVSFGKTPLDEIILAPGARQLRLVHPERETFTTTREFAAGQRETLTIELQPKE